MTEAGLETAVRDLLRLHGLYGYHTADSRRSPKGWPDWVVVGSGIIYRELKAERGQVTAEQRRVGRLITEAGGDWAVWRPSDLESGLIVAELRAISGGGVAA